MGDQKGANLILGKGVPEKRRNPMKTGLPTQERQPGFRNRQRVQDYCKNADVAEAASHNHFLWNDEKKKRGKKGVGAKTAIRKKKKRRMANLGKIDTTIERSIGWLPAPLGGGGKITPRTGLQERVSEKKRKACQIYLKIWDDQRCTRGNSRKGSPVIIKGHILPGKV